jgi:integrase/transcription elongation factor Elf1/Zn ribbon nucleic-acid-binding protein
VEINWKKDYHNEFVCPKCQQQKVGLGGFQRGKRQFYCKDCKCILPASISLNKRSLYLESRLKDKGIDWNKDYQGEFVCPKCQTSGMNVWGVKKPNNKRMFRCSTCRNVEQESCQIRIKAIPDPTNPKVTWYTNHRIRGFVCPECQAKDIYFVQTDKYNKVRFYCRSCKKCQYNSIELTRSNLSYYSNNPIPVITFNWEEDLWDLRAINPNFDQRDIPRSTVNFAEIEADWFKQEVKKYIHHLCKAGNSFGTIILYISALRFFSRYLYQTNITSFESINRSLILDYLAQLKTVNKQKLGGLRNFFIVGTVRGWFNIDQDIIRDEDYPKQRRGNPDPLSDTVREQIEQNLHLLPDPIARMWIICFFAAMRPAELALLKQDCLVQEGQHWKLVWHRKKGNNYHEVPITRAIAKVVQEQQEYIKDLWQNEWDYLFCHYHELSSVDPSQTKLEPVKKVIPGNKNNPLLASIRCLIRALDIRDENGQPAKFTTKLLRLTRLTQLFEQGHDLAVVSAWAGHKHFATTSTYYTEVSCELMETEAGHIQKALVNSDGHHLSYESLPKSFWETPQAHKLELSGTHINTPIYGYCGLSLDQNCHKFRACYTCQSFVAVPEKLPQYIKTRDELKSKKSKALASGHEVLVEQFGRQAEQLDKIITNLQEAV